jgi:hypothetical protein
MKNHNGDSMKIEVKNYHFKNLYNKLYDSDWLDAKLIIINSAGKVSINLEFLLVEELERIINWLNQLLNKSNVTNKLEFIDPNLRLKLMTRSRIPVLKVLYNVNETTIECWELIIKTADINKLVNELKKTINNYPCRCGFIH